MESLAQGAMKQIVYVVSDHFIDQQLKLWWINLPSAEVAHLFRESNLNSSSCHPLRSCIRGAGNQHSQGLTNVLQ